MFGMIDEEILMNVHDMFNRIGFYPKTSEDMDYDLFIRKVIRKINYGESIYIAEECINILQYIAYRFEKITNAIDKYNELWCSISFDSSIEIEEKSEEEVLGTVYVTNAIFKNKKEINFMSASIEDGDEDIFSFERNGDTYFTNEESEWYIKPSFWSSKKMKLYKNDRNIADVVLKKDWSIALINNSLEYDLAEKDGVMSLYKKEYINSLYSLKDVDEEEKSADFIFTLIDSNKITGLSMARNFDEDLDMDLLLLLSVCPYLIIRRKMKNQEMTMYGAMWQMMH